MSFYFHEAGKIIPEVLTIRELGIIELSTLREWSATSRLFVLNDAGEQPDPFGAAIRD
jgi:hypothetical protein